ncbi:MAG: DUF4293 domain-containing protein [Fimbriimonadaceae bacterium]|nr:DUF4293 domain-containing protein [Chitinophagales bacterium]
MIQRIQTIYLFLAAIICILFLMVPSAENAIEGVVVEEFDFFARDNIYSAAISIAVAFLSFAAIFFYKNRKLQIRIAFISIALLFVLIAQTYYALTQSAEDYSITYFIATPFIAIVFLFLAIRSIRKDEALVKSMDRFR